MMPAPIPMGGQALEPDQVAGGADGVRPERPAKRVRFVDDSEGTPRSTTLPSNVASSNISLVV